MQCLFKQNDNLYAQVNRKNKVYTLPLRGGLLQPNKAAANHEWQRLSSLVITHVIVPGRVI